jgi:hypothetical protein
MWPRNKPGRDEIPAREAGIKGAPDEKIRRAHSIEKHAKALALALDKAHTTFWCDLDEQLSTLARQGSYDIAPPSVSSLRHLAEAACRLRVDCSERAANLRKRKRDGLPLPPGLSALEETTALREIILSVADTFQALTGQGAFASIKAFRAADNPNSPAKGGPFVAFINQVWLAWGLGHPPSGATIYALKREHDSRPESRTSFK